MGDVAWVIGMGDVAWGFVEGSDMADVVHPHPSTRGGVNVGGCQCMVMWWE